MKCEIGSCIIDLESRNWRVSTDGKVFFWDSLGPAASFPPESSLSSANSDILDPTRFDGNWSSILIQDDALVLLSDLVRSHTLFYARIDSRWIVTDSVGKMRDYVDDWLLDTDAAEVFEKTGFTLNERTLIRGVNVLEAASRVRLPLDENEGEVSFWGLPLYEQPGVVSAEEFSKRYTLALDEAFTKLLKQTRGRQLVLPLSGGLDSRLVAAWLKKMGAPYVIAFTYGAEDSAEAAISETVAQKLGLELIVVPMDVEKVRALWFSEVADSFRSATWKGSALPHVQDWYALWWMKRHGLVENDAVFLPGHTPVGAMHHLELLEGAVTGSDVSEALAQHHTLNPAEKNKILDAKEFRRAVKRAFEQVPQGGRRVQNVVEWFNYRERQAKYINNSMAAYEFFGWDWALPLYWQEPLAVWISGAEELTAARDWYRDFVDSAYAQQSGEPVRVEYFLPPAESSRLPFRHQIVSFSRKTGLNRVASWGWALKVQARHPLALEAFVNAKSDIGLVTSLVNHGNLMRIWAEEFLGNRWGSQTQSLVPPRPENASGKPRLLIISYSDIEKDARLRKQIDLFTADYDVTVVGHGRPFETDAELILFPNADTKRTERIRAALLHAKQCGLAQKLEANNLAARKLLRGQSFDAVIANDIEPVGMAIDLFGADKVHADLHEYYPGLQDEDPAWVKLRQPYYQWMLANNAAKVASVTTVSEGISKRYAGEFGFASGVVANALPFQNMQPGLVHDPIALVHLGAALPNRHIETMMRAAAASTTNLTFDLYLTGAGTRYYQSLQELAKQLGERVHLKAPLGRSDLIPTLNTYDVGIHSLPATATNNRLALPNKFFDFVQACLAVVVGPTPEMARLVEEFDLGIVADGFNEEDLVSALDRLNPSAIAEWKRNARDAAEELDVTKMLDNWSEPVKRIVEGQT